MTDKKSKKSKNSQKPEESEESKEPTSSEETEEPEEVEESKKAEESEEPETSKESKKTKDSKEKDSKKKSRSRLIILLVIIVVVVAVAVIAAVILLNTSDNSANETTGSEDTATTAHDEAYLSSETDETSYAYEVEIVNLGAALTEDPDDFDTAFQIALLYYNWATQVDEGSITSIRDLTDLYQAATQATENALAIESDDLNALMLAGYSYFYYAQSLANEAESDSDVHATMLDAYEKAADYYVRALEANTDNTIDEAEITYMIVNEAISDYELGDTDTAISLLEQRREEDQTSFELLYNLGIFYEDAGDTNAAAECYEKAASVAKMEGNATAQSYAEARLAAL